MRLILFTFVCFFGLVACQTMPTRYEKETRGRWDAKVLIKDKKKSKSAIVNVDLWAKKNEKLRMEVTAALGTPVATLTLNGSQVDYALIRQKRFYSGQAQPSVLRPILSVPLNPQLMYNILFDEPIADKNWSCTKGENGYLAKCSNLQNDLEIRWKNRKGTRKTVFVDHPQASIQMNFSGFKRSFEESAEFFRLNVPKTFRRFRVR